MEQLLERDGAMEFFLEAASMNVDWKGSSTDIERNKLETIANEVNRKFGTALDPFDIRLTWAKIRALWETWVKAKRYTRRGKANSTTGTIDIDDFEWDQLLRVVPEAEVFRRKPMILPDTVCTIFDRTSPWLAPEEHSSQRRNMSSSRTPSKRRGPSPEEVEEDEINACMLKVHEIDALKSSEIYIQFCLSIFKDAEIRKTFDYLPNKILRRKYVIMKYNEQYCAH
ncbi:hypothetical protein CMV_027283 [Castanea mollissima]|uniref:Myb/SANT-like domain-containing protein n=1 Tax=Castanea mollissima TaxID=60419 RepID=A0A8J4V2W6_9ROSI|nr:hypothetical protein CMV_027283 [Castanea mollissima]